MAVGIVVVSHSQRLAEAAVELAMIMVRDVTPPIALAAGMPDGDFGTDATRVMEAIVEVDQGDGVAVFTDMGSAVMSAELGAELSGADNIRLLKAPFVEGLTAAVVRAAGGASLDEVADEAEAAMLPKLVALGDDGSGSAGAGGAAPSTDASTAQPQGGAGQGAVDAAGSESASGASADVEVINEVGLHARPAAQFATAARKFDATLTVSSGSRGPVSAISIIGLATLGAKKGDTLHIEATGAQAKEAVDALVAMVKDGFGET